MTSKKTLASIMAAFLWFFSLNNANAVQVDVLIVYDTATNNYFNGSPNTMLYNMVEQANSYYDASNVDVQLNVVGTQLFNSNLSDDFLGDLRRNQSIADLRDQLGADYVTWVIDDKPSANYCGVGYVTTNSGGAYNIVRRSCMARSYAHEMGHTMGLSHSLAQGSRGSDYDWGIGYGVNGVFSTIMAYTSAYNTRARTFRFSSPEFECSGYPCGIRNEADAALAINNVKNKIASHRDSPSLVQTGDVEITQSRGQWYAVDFDQSFSAAPVVIMGPPSYDGVHPSTMRVRNISVDGFEFQLDEWDYLDGNHTSEVISWVALSQGEHNWGGIQAYAGVTSNVTGDWKSVSVGDNINSDPVVLAQKHVTVSQDSEPASSIRLRNVDSDGFDLQLKEQESNSNSIAGSDVHFLAITKGTGSINDISIRAGATGNSVTHDWNTVNFSELYDNPNFLANIQTNDGGDTSALRYRSLTNASVQVRVEEETSRDSETNHTSEVVGWAVFEN